MRQSRFQKSRGKDARLLRRQNRIRRRISGSPERPRLAVTRTLKHIYAQLVDDVAGKTLAFVGTNGKDVEGKTKSEKAAWAGRKLAQVAVEQGISQVVFDRGGRKYHGRVRAVAEAARENGLKF